MKNILILAVLLLVFNGIYAQHNDTNHDHEEHGGHHHRTELGIANSPVYFLNEKEFAYGLHLHLTRQLFKSDFGAGIGYERIFDAHGHNTISAVAAYRPLHELVFNLAPGITWEDDERDLLFALHIEGAYEFQIGHFHIGPSAEFAYDQEDIHLSIGIHTGIGF